MVTPYQGWGGPAVQYRQSTPVLGNLGPVTDWRSAFCAPGLDRERQSFERGKGPVQHQISGPPPTARAPSFSHDFIANFVVKKVKMSSRHHMRENRNGNCTGTCTMPFLYATYGDWTGDLYRDLLECKIWGLDWTGRSSRYEDWCTGGLVVI